MITVVNLRGTNGSGKTTLVRSLLNDPRGDWVADWSPSLTKAQTHSRKRRPIANGYYAHAWNLHVIGSYDKVCGGTDGLSPVELEARMWAAVQAGRSVIFEGYFAANARERWLLAGPKLKAIGARYLDCYLSTPMETCVERVLARRAAAGNTKPYDPDKHTRYNWRNQRNNLSRFTGGEVIWLPHPEPEVKVRQLLGLPEPLPFDPTSTTISAYLLIPREGDIMPDNETENPNFRALSDGDSGAGKPKGHHDQEFVTTRPESETEDSPAVAETGNLTTVDPSQVPGPTALARQMIAAGASDMAILAATRTAFGPQSPRPLKFTGSDLKRLRVRVAKNAGAAAVYGKPEPEHPGNVA